MDKKLRLTLALILDNQSRIMQKYDNGFSSEFAKAIKTTRIMVNELTKEEKPKKEIKKPLIDRQRQFYLDVQQVCNQENRYFVIMEDFCRYWNEENKSNTKAKFELQRTFNIKLRLSNWEKNNYGSKKNTAIDLDEEYKRFQANSNGRL